MKGTLPFLTSAMAFSAMAVEPVTILDQPGWCNWCPSPAYLPDGRVALAFSRWPTKFGFESWCAKSEIALAISKDGPLGPYEFVGTILPGSGRDGDFDRDVTHNPCLFPDGGKYYLFYMGTYSDLKDGRAPGASSGGVAKGCFRMNQRVGVAVADRVEGPYRRTGRPLFELDPDMTMMSNPAICRMPNGKYLLIVKWGEADGIPRGWPKCRVNLFAAIGDSPLGPFKIVRREIFSVNCANFPGEDPYLWTEGDTICCTIHDMGKFYSSEDRALIRFESKDGVSWKNCGVLFPRGNISRLERPAILCGADGSRLLFAASKPKAGDPNSLIVAYPGVVPEPLRRKEPAKRFLDPVPAPPDPSEWAFKAELAEPVASRAKEAYRIVDEYGLAGETATVRTDLDRFMASAGKAPAKTLVLRRGAVDGYESYRLDVAANGDVTLTAGDDDGIRRAACYFEDRVQAGDLKDTVRKPWLRHRISRCFFGPIKRAPFFRDELMDDIDYYPDAYLNRLAHEGINGLWLTVELRNLVETSFNARDRDAPRRLAKLRRTVAACRRYGIRTWVFCIEPRRMEKDDPLLGTLPADAVAPAPYGSARVLCTASPAGRRYLAEAFRDLFEQVPGLPGVINISHGERATTCLSSVSAVDGSCCRCPACAKLAPWQIHWNTSEAIVRGMRAVDPKAEFLSWFYQPSVDYRRADWVPEVARHLPDGVTLVYNFESGAVKEQLGRYRPGGDYWLSYAGPAPSFGRVASASREANGRLGAKIQVGCSHECATVPFVPVPGLLYRKYAAMRQARCTTVMQCWYFGNCPGVMNKAAGELAFFDFSEDEDAFLLKLAKPDWGADAPAVAKLWKDFSDAYANYPLSNGMQYYGPFHAGVAWPLHPEIAMSRLGRTWKPQDPPSGDTIGECLENHTLEEAAILAERMRVGSEAKDAKGGGALAALEAKYAGDRDRTRDLAVIRALQLLFASGSDILEFYRLREIAVTASRDDGNAARARKAVDGMRALILREQRVTAAMLPLARADSRLGFHSEAESHQFHAKKLEWRLRQLDAALAETDRIAGVLAAGGTYPLSDHELSAPQVRVGETVRTNGCAFTVRFLENGDFEVTGDSQSGVPLVLRAFNRCATAWPIQVTLGPDGCDLRRHNVIAPTAVVREYKAARRDGGWSFRLVLDARGWGIPERRPGWIHFERRGQSVWPTVGSSGEYRLNIGGISPEQYGRIVEGENR